MNKPALHYPPEHYYEVRNWIYTTFDFWPVSLVMSYVGYDITDAYIGRRSFSYRLTQSMLYPTVFHFRRDATWRDIQIADQLGMFPLELDRLVGLDFPCRTVLAATDNDDDFYTKYWLTMFDALNNDEYEN